MRDVAAVRTFTPVPQAARPAAGASGFAEIFSQALDKVSGQLAAADAQVAGMVSGEGVEVHDVVIALEEAKLALSFAVEVRNRLLEAYQELSKMQV